MVKEATLETGGKGGMCTAGFLDLGGVFFGDGTGFLDTFELGVWGEVFLPFDGVLSDLGVVEAFLLPLASDAEDVEGFSVEATSSFAFCSLSFSFPSLGGAGTKSKIKS